jgi:streptogramin lyase
VYNALGGPLGKGHVTFDRAQSQYLDAGARTLNIATNGGLTIVSVVRFTGTAGSWERIIDLGNGPDKDNIVVARPLTTSNVHVNVRNGASVIIDTTSSSGVLVQNSWLTVVVTYRASTREYWLTVNGVGVSTGISPAAVTDRTVSKTWMGRSNWGYNAALGYDAFFNGEMAGVFVLDEYLSTNATSAIADAMIRGVDLTDTSGASSCTACVKRSLTPVQGYVEGTSTFSALTLPGSLTGRQDKFWGAVLAPNGHIFMVPCQAGSIGDLDPSTGALSLIDISSVIPPYWNYCGGVLAPNGLIYFVPHNADNIGVFNPFTRVFSIIDISSVIAHDVKWVGGVLAPNGHIYFVPYNADSIGDFNPTTAAFSLISIPFFIGGSSSGYKYVGGVLAPNGHIIFVPHHANSIGDFDPVKGVFTVVDISSVIAQNSKYSGGVLAPNGHIYFVPFFANNIGDFNPDTGAFSVVDISSFITHDWKYEGAVLGPNGLIYFVPSKSDNIGVFNPSAGAFSIIDISSVISHDRKYVGGVLGHNGRIYLVPRDAESVGQIHLGNQEPAYKVAGGVDVTLGALLSPYFNKL